MLRKEQTEQELTSNAPYRVPVPLPIVVGRIHAGTIEVEVVGVVTIVHRRRPVVAVAALIVRRATIVVAREDGLVGSAYTRRKLIKVLYNPELLVRSKDSTVFAYPFGIGYFWPFALSNERRESAAYFTSGWTPHKVILLFMIKLCKRGMEVTERLRIFLILKRSRMSGGVELCRYEAFFFCVRPDDIIQLRNVLCYNKPIVQGKPKYRKKRGHV